MNFYYRKETWGYILQDNNNDRIWGIGNDYLKDKHLKCIIDSLCNNKFPYRNNGWFYRGRLPRLLHISSPISISWSLTDKCNSNCVFCCNDSNKHGNYGISTKEIKDILMMLKKLGVMRIVFGGGEPTIRNDLIEILSYSKKLKLNTVVATNGILLNEKLIESISENCCTLQISLDTLDSQKYLKLRGVDELQTVKNNIVKAKKINAHIRIITVVNNENFYEIDDIAKFLIENNIKQWFIFNILKSGRAKNQKNDFFVDSKKLNEKIQYLFAKFPQIEIFTWGSQKYDQISVYIESNGDFVIRNYETEEKIKLNSDGFDKVVEAWNSIEENIKYNSFLNFIQPNKANPINNKEINKIENH